MEMRMNTKEANQRQNLSLIEMECGLRKALQEHQVDSQIVSSAMALLISGVREQSALEILQKEAYKAMLPTVDAYVATHGIRVHPASPLGIAFGVLTVLAAESATQSAMAQVLKQVNARDWQTYLENRPRSEN
jgi:hypothetical protein